MLIIRNHLEESLYNFIKSGNGILIGSPGIGKTYLLNKICLRFKKEDIPVLYLPIDKFDIESNQDLESTLQFKGDFIDGLSNQPEIQDKKGYLIIDSFDSAKSEKSKKFFLNLMERAEKQLTNKWQIIVSVRTFDAKKSQKLLEIFPKSIVEEDSEYHLPEIPSRHFFIPKLTNTELRQALEENISPNNISTISNLEIWDLLKTPFNLWLFEQVLVSGKSLIEFQKIRSQVKLLDLFWSKRIHDSDSWQEKEIILRSATRKMVESKSLFVNIGNIYQSEKKNALNSLLSDQILVETSQSSLNYAFSHNILFDYAVSILLIDDTEKSFFTFISEDVSRQLFLRPSLDFYFTRLWYSNRVQFWKIFWKIIRSSEVNMSILLRLTIINVLITEIKKISDLDPFFSDIERGDYQGIKAILYILQSLDVQEFRNDKIWLAFLENVSLDLNKNFIWNFAWILSKIIDDAKTGKKTKELKYSGKIGRSLLTWILKERKKTPENYIDGVGANWAVPIVAKTFCTDPKESERLLREILAFRHEPNFLIMYIYRLVTELENIWLTAPEFVELIYLTVFSYEETSQEKTSMGTPVLPLSSTRRQDYDLCYYSLVNSYPKFLSESPLAAVKTAIIALNSYIIQHHILPFINPGYHLEDVRKKYFLNKKEVSIYSDHCIIWDTSGYIHEPIKIADELFTYLERRAEQKDHLFIENIINIFIENVKVTFFWRRLLISATKYPEMFAEKLFDFCITKPILSDSETIKEIGDFLQKSSKFFTSEQLFKIEKTILEIPKEGDLNEKQAEYLKDKRNRLLFRIPKHLLQTEEGIAIRISIEDSKKIPSNEPLVKWEGGTREYTKAESLCDRGVDLSQEQNKKLFQSFIHLELFSSKWLNDKPDIESIQKILPVLKEFYSLLESQSSPDIKIKNIAWTHLASCVSEISGGIDSTDIATFYFCKEVLLKCAHHPEPAFSLEYHSTFDSLAWSPDPRTEAASGLPKLGSIIRDEEILCEVRNLAIKELVPAVRYLAISRLLLIWKSAPDFVWDLTAEIIQKERVPNILFDACGNVGHIFKTDENKAQALLEFIFEKTDIMEHPDRSNPFIPIIVQLSVIYKNEWATELLKETIIKNPRKYSKHFGYIVFEISRIFDPRFSENHQECNGVSERAIEVLNKIIAATHLRILELISNIDKTENITNDSEINDLYLVIHDMILRLFFAVQKDETKSENSRSRISDKDRRKLYFQFRPLLEKIIKFQNSENMPSFNAQTLHYFVQIFNEIVEFDPEFVIHTMAALLKKGGSAYAFDPLASDEVLKLGEKIISDNKDVLQDGEILKDFIFIIDSFVRNGNKKMLQFVWRLDEIYR